MCYRSLHGGHECSINKKHNVYGTISMKYWSHTSFFCALIVFRKSVRCLVVFPGHRVNVYNVALPRVGGNASLTRVCKLTGLGE